MRKRNNSDWVTPWALILSCALIVVVSDHEIAYQVKSTVGKWDFDRLITAVFIAFGVVSLSALVFRIFTWRDE